MARSPVKRFFGTLLFFVALISILAFVLLLYLEAIGDTNVPLIEDLDQTAIVVSIILGIIFFVLLLLILIRRWDRAAEEAAAAEAFFIPDADKEAALRAQQAALDALLQGDTTFAHGPDVVVYNLPTVPLMGRAWDAPAKPKKGQPALHTYYFPRSVESGLYVNNYVTIDGKGTQVKLRTLLAGPKDADKKAFDPDHVIKAKKDDKRKADKAAAPVPPPTGPLPNPFEAPAPPAAEPPSGPATVVPPEAAGPGRDQSQLLLERAAPAQPSRDFMAELEERLAKRGTREPAAAPERSEVFYQYVGDNHPVDDLEGIGPVLRAKLHDLGVQTTDRLCYEDAGWLADKLGQPRKTVEQWQAMAELVKVSGIGPQFAEALARGGVMGITDLKRRGAQGIADDVNAVLDASKVTIIGQKLTQKRVESWQKMAADMRRVRQKVPEK